MSFEWPQVRLTKAAGFKVYKNCAQSQIGASKVVGAACPKQASHDSIIWHHLAIAIEL